MTDNIFKETEWEGNVLHAERVSPSAKTTNLKLGVSGL